MEQHQKNVVLNEKILRKYMVLSPTVIKIMEKDHLFPESFVSRLKKLRPLEQNSLMVDYVINFPGAEAYENLLFLLRKTSQSWLTEIIESGKSVDSFMHFRPEEIVAMPGETTNVQTAAGYSGYASDYMAEDPQTMVNTAGGNFQSLLGGSVVGLVQQCRQRQIGAEQRLVNLQREQMALKQRLGENQREQLAVQAEQVALRQLASNADHVARLARQTEIASSIAHAPFSPSNLAHASASRVLGLLRNDNERPPAPIGTNLTLEELGRFGQSSFLL